jgi:eukaryotic-like serine/threonine-protein kinase
MPARYRKLRKIADGGMAEIFLAIQQGAEGFERRVVLKQILAPLLADPKFKNMIIDEAHVAMSLNHSNIVQVLDLGQSKGRYYLVLELVDGWDLNQIIMRVRKTEYALPPEVSLYVVAEVCRALNYAHAQTRGGKPLGIVHRDVSPHNVLVSEHGEVKLTDFGIAKALGRRERTGQGVIKGKLAFMSPEQAAGSELDARSDLFSVGTMLYLMFTGRRPFESPTDLETILRVQQCQFPPPREIKPDLPEAIAEIIEKTMAREPAHRYQTGEEMLVDLEAAQRSVFRPAGQTELRRWLLELGERDQAPPISRAVAAALEPTEAEEELELEEDIVFEQAVGGDTTLPPFAGNRGRSGKTASSVLRAAESLQAPPNFDLESRLDLGSESLPSLLPPPARLPSLGRRRWLVAGVVTGAAATSGVLAMLRMRDAGKLKLTAPTGPGWQPPISKGEPLAASEAPATATVPPPAPATPPTPTVETPAATESPLAAAAPGSRDATVTSDTGPAAVAQGPDAAGADTGGSALAQGAVKEDDPEEDEEALLKLQEPDIAEKVIGEEEAAAPPVAVAPSRPERPAALPSSAPRSVTPPPSAPPARPTSTAGTSPSRPTPRREPTPVRIQSRPDGAVVKIGNRVLGRAPMNLRFNPGITYELTFVKSGYQSTRKRFTASGRKGQTVAASLKKRPASKRRNFFQRLFGG